MADVSGTLQLAGTRRTGAGLPWATCCATLPVVLARGWWLGPARADHYEVHVGCSINDAVSRMTHDAGAAARAILPGLDAPAALQRCRLCGCLGREDLRGVQDVRPVSEGGHTCINDMQHLERGM